MGRGRFRDRGGRQPAALAGAQAAHAAAALLLGAGAGTVLGGLQFGPGASSTGTAPNWPKATAVASLGLAYSATMAV